MSQLQLDMERSAVFSPCRTWRYQLRRIWDDSTLPAMFIGLNPSTADEVEDDPTVRRCIRFARDWGYGGLLMTNMFGFRSTDPEGLLAARDPIGPGNDMALEAAAAEADIVVAAWGMWGTRIQPWTARPRDIDRMIEKPLHCLKRTSSGAPNHPLYLAASLTPKPWSPA